DWHAPSPLSGGGFLDDFFERRDALLDLDHPVHAQRQHAFLHGKTSQRVGRRTLQDLTAKRARQRHHLVETLAAAVARAGTGIACRALEERADFSVDRESVHLLVAVLVLLLALLANAPHQPLR